MSAAPLKTPDGQGCRSARSSTPPCSASSPTCRSCTRSSPPSSPPAVRARRAPRPAPRCRVAARSRSSRRAPATPVRAPPVSPHFSGGGVALGPKPRKYDQKTPKKMVKARPALGAQRPCRRGQGLVVDDWGFDTPKTKAAKAALAALGIDGKALVVVDPDDTNTDLELPQPPGSPAHRTRPS